MTELSRALLASAREGLAPDADVMARVRARVAAATTTAVATTAATATTVAATPVAATPVAPAAAPAIAKSSIVVKLGALLLVVAVIGAVALVRKDSAIEAPRVTLASPELEESRANVQVGAADASSLPAAPPITSRTAQAEAPKPLAAGASATHGHGRTPASLSREVELIDLAMASLRKDAPAVALEAIRTFERETLGRGQMAEEASAIEIEARCRLREDVTARIATFDRKWPSSAQRARIDAACFTR